MNRLKLLNIYKHPIAKKYLRRSGLAHALSAAEHAFVFAVEKAVNPDLAVKAALLHDIGHYTWYSNGKWDFDKYRANDIHPIKGAARAHKLLIRLGEEPKNAKKIALAILLHTDSYLPDGDLRLEPLQEVVALADKADEEPNGAHHYKDIPERDVIKILNRLDERIDLYLRDLYKEKKQAITIKKTLVY